MWNLKTKINNQKRNKLIDPEDRLMVAKWDGVGRPGEKDEGIKKHKFVVTGM